MSGFLFKKQSWLNLQAIKNKFSPLSKLSEQIKTDDDYMMIRSPSSLEVSKIEDLVFQTWGRNLAE